VILAFLAACDPGDSGAEDETSVVLDDAHLVALDLAPELSTIFLVAETDATLEWSGVTTDWLGQPFDADQETFAVEFLRSQRLGSIDLGLALVRDELTQDMVEVYGWEKGAGPYGAATVSEFEDHTPPVKPSELDPGKPWLLVLRDVNSTIRFVVEVDASTEVVAPEGAYPVTDGMSRLAATAPLDVDALPIAPGAELDWHNLRSASDGANFDAARAQHVVTAPHPGGDSASWSTLAASLAAGSSAATGGNTSVPAPPAIADASPGDRLLLALDCEDCEPIFPAALFVMERQ
jgi:hypothetical protein